MYAVVQDNQFSVKCLRLYKVINTCCLLVISLHPKVVIRWNLKGVLQVLRIQLHNELIPDHWRHYDHHHHWYHQLRNYSQHHFWFREKCIHGGHVEDCRHWQETMPLGSRC